MTNISKKKLKKEISEKITKQFVGVLADLDKFYKTSSFVFEFFTRSERVMFAKRLATILLVLKDFSPSAICEILLVSPSTVNKILRTIDRGGYKNIRRYFNDKKNRKSISSQLEIIIRAGMPPMGRGRWTRVNKLLSEK